MSNNFYKKEKKMKKGFFSYLIFVLVIFIFVLSFADKAYALVYADKGTYEPPPVKYEPPPVYWEPEPVDSKKEPAKSPIPPPEEKKVVIDPCATVTCPDTCEGNIRKSSGKCVNGACVYDPPQTCPSQSCSGSYILSGGCKAGKCVFSTSTKCPEVRCYGNTMGIQPICQMSGGTATCVYQKTVQRCTERCGQNDGCGTCPNDDFGRCGYCGNPEKGCEFRGKCYGVDANGIGITVSFDGLYYKCLCSGASCSMDMVFSSRSSLNRVFNSFIT